MKNPPGNRATIFGENAEIYDENRPAYPPQVRDHVLALGDVACAVEVGAGTGIATSSFAAVGRKIICVEPSREMAQVLRHKNLPGVEVVVSDFESWPGTEEPVDLVYAAQSWHWINPETGCAKAMAMLRPAGVIALMWNVPLNRYGGFEPVYQEYAPEVLAERDSRVKKRDRFDWGDDLEMNGFRDVVRFVHSWSVELSPTEFSALCSTYSDHMMIPQARRKLLLGGLESAVVELGGSVRVGYETRVFSGRK